MPLTALCLSFRDPASDERTYQRSVVTRSRSDVVWVDADRAGGPFGRGPDDLFGANGGPPLVHNWFLHRAMAQSAHASGILRVLDGEDGDGVVGGSPLYLADLLGRGHLIDWLRESGALASARHVPVGRLRRRSLADLRTSARSGTVGRAYPLAVRDLVADGYLSSLTAEAHRLWSSLPAGVGHPFLDRQVLEHALVMPRSQRIQHGVSKVVLRRAMSDRLPPEVLHRTGKADLSSAFLDAVQGPQRHWVDEGLALARRDPSLSSRLTSSSSTPQALVAEVRLATVALWRQWLQVRTEAMTTTVFAADVSGTARGAPPSRYLIRREG